MSDIYVDSNWCPECGEPRGVCKCNASADRAQELYDSCFGNAHVLARVLALSEIDAAQDKTMLNSLRRMLETTRAVVDEKQSVIDSLIVDYTKLSKQNQIMIEALREISIIAFQHGGVCKPVVLEGIIDDMQRTARKALRGEK